MRCPHRFIVIGTALLGLALFACHDATGSGAEPVLPVSDSMPSRIYQLRLEPGKGAIVFLGTRGQLDQLRRDYFGKAPARPGGTIDRLLLGFLTGTDVEARAHELGLDYDTYVDRMLKLYRDAGATAIYVYRGNLEHRLGARFAAVAARHGLKVIIQPNDVYFRSQDDWKDDGSTAAPLKPYAGAADYMRRYLLPLLEQRAPAHANDPNILAWSPVEELPAADEVLYAQYKAAFKRLFPRHLLYQIDSQQSTLEALRSKRPPFPDITGLDRYPWWTQPDGLGLWTPHYAARLFYSWIKDYPRFVHELFGAPAVLVMQGCAELSWADAAWGARHGWKPNADFVPPNSPHVRWVPKLNKFRVMNRHLAPENAWRLQIWMGLARGYKGFMYWCAGPVATPARWRRAFESGEFAQLGLIGDDLTTHHYLQEVKDTWQDIRRYEALLLNTYPAGDLESSVRVKGERIYTGLLKDGAGRRFLVIVNGDIGRWDGTSPETLNFPATRLTLDEFGQFTNYTVLHDARVISVEIADPGVTPFDLRTLKPLARESSGGG